MKSLTFRLKQGDLLKEEIERRTKDVPAGVLLSVVGGLDNIVFRLPKGTAERHPMLRQDGPFEIVSGTGTISPDGCHIHMSVADTSGQVLGGHLKDGCVVYMTAEVVIGILDDVSYTREVDAETGFAELKAAQ